MRRLLALVLVPTWLVAAPAANAQCDGSSQTAVAAGAGTLVVGSQETKDECGGPGSAGGGPVDPTDLVGFGLDTICVTTAMELGRNPIEYCGLDDDGEPPGLTPGMISTAFRTIPLAPSLLVIQPPNGRTLVNFETNFYTENAGQDVTVQVLTHQVALRIRPVWFTWHYGDGTVESTESPGAAYPDLQITHVYQRKGAVAPSVDTTYAATYQVDGQGPWRDVDGTVTVAGRAAGLEVLTATPVLVGYDG